jgi:hypothetical protein
LLESGTIKTYTEERRHIDKFVETYGAVQCLLQPHYFQWEHRVSPTIGNCCFCRVYNFRVKCGSVLLEEPDCNFCLVMAIIVNISRNSRQYREMICQSQWPRGLRHEPPSPARTLGSWVRIPLEVRMSVYNYSVIVLLSVSVAVL